MSFSLSPMSRTGGTAPRVEAALHGLDERDVHRGDLGVPRDELVDLGPGDVAPEVAVRHLGRLAKARRQVALLRA
jgi:hypothetical protein